MDSILNSGAKQVNCPQKSEEDAIMTKPEHTGPEDRHGTTPLPHEDGCECTLCRIYGYSDQWDDFDHVYIEFALEYSQQMLTYTLGVELLSEFPKNLPGYILIPILAKRDQLLAVEMHRRGIASDPQYVADDAFFKLAAKVELTEQQHRIRCAYEGLYALARYGKKIPEMEFPQFGRFLMAQNVVVVCAFAEGFLANSIRRLCSARPAPFDSWKNRTSNKLVGLDESDVLEQFIFEMGYGSFEKKLGRVERIFGFKVPTPESDRAKIAELFLIRNCLVHNAGLVSKAYKQRGTHRHALSVGDEMPLPENAIEELIDTLVDAVAAVYQSVAVDVLKRAPESLMFGPHRNLRKEHFEPYGEE